MIDWARVAELREEIGEDGFTEVAELFMQEIAQVVERLPDQIDANALKSDLHFVKGSALNLGFSDLATLCAAGEGALAKAEMVDSTEIVTCYRNSITAFMANGISG